jgi:Protein of unknown function (DUF3445)
VCDTLCVPIVLISLKDSHGFVLPDELIVERLFAQPSYRPMMGLTSIDAGKFFRNRYDASLLSQRRRVIAEQRIRCVFENDVSEEVIRFAGTWIATSEISGFAQLGGIWEPDFVLVQKQNPQNLVGGCVCFPTGWHPEEKMGKPLVSAHGIVPGLNPALGAKIAPFIAGLAEGRCYQRTNWGLTASDQLDQHPSCQIPEIRLRQGYGGQAGGQVKDEVFLRIEWQALTSLTTDLAVFGIRIFHLRLEQLDAHSRGLLKENLRTMPAEMLRYKRIEHCRDWLVERL